jgi:enterochelin esterase-like enzyme
MDQLMKKLNFSFILAVIAGTLNAQVGGRVMDNLSLQSNILKMERKYSIYLPPDYETSSRSYPVLYLLHGRGDDHTGWIQFGEVKQIADHEILSGAVTAMIIVMPDANTGRHGYVNDPAGQWRYEDFFFNDFIPFVEKKWRIKAEKQYRAIAGLSMGGEGTFIYALHHPEMFSAACPLSAATGPLNFEDLDTYLEKYDLWAEMKKMPEGSDRENYYKKYSVLSLIENMPDSQKKAVRWYIDCGDDDFLFEGNSLVHIAMRKKEIPHEFRIRDGVHSWVYWREALPEVLQFISKGFHR